MLVFEHKGIETVNIRWNDSIITTVTHDDDGFYVMNKVIDAMKELAECAGIEYIVIF